MSEIELEEEEVLGEEVEEVEGEEEEYIEEGEEVAEEEEVVAKPVLALPPFETWLFYVSEYVNMNRRLSLLRGEIMSLRALPAMYRTVAVRRKLRQRVAEYNALIRQREKIRAAIIRTCPHPGKLCARCPLRKCPRVKSKKER